MQAGAARIGPHSGCLGRYHDAPLAADPHGMLQAGRNSSVNVRFGSRVTVAAGAVFVPAQLRSHMRSLHPAHAAIYPSAGNFAGSCLKPDHLVTQHLTALTALQNVGTKRPKKLRREMRPSQEPVVQCLAPTLWKRYAGRRRQKILPVLCNIGLDGHYRRLEPMELNVIRRRRHRHRRSRIVELAGLGGRSIWQNLVELALDQSPNMKGLGTSTRHRPSRRPTVCLGCCSRAATCLP